MTVPIALLGLLDRVTGARLAAALDGGEPVIVARDVTLSFGPTPALRGATLAVRAGEILAVTGPSGSGKSTLLHRLTGILTPDSGEIRFAGARLDTMCETARSALTFAPQTISEIGVSGSMELDGYRQLAEVVILTSLPIAGCTLAVSIAGGLAERKRPFSLLRLTGAPLSVLQRVITLEAAAPLLITAIVSIGVGLLTAQLFLHAQLESIRASGAEYYLVVLAGLFASVAIIASMLPLLKRITAPATARNE